MRFSEPVRMADDGEHSPVWARTRRRSGNPLVGIKEQSLAEGGAIIDGWIAKGVSTVRGEAPRVADEAVDAAGAAAEKAGDVAQAGAAAASDEMKKQ